MFGVLIEILIFCSDCFWNLAEIFSHIRFLSKLIISSKTITRDQRFQHIGFLFDNNWDCFANRLTSQFKEMQALIKSYGNKLEDLAGVWIGFLSQIVNPSIISHMVNRDWKASCGLLQNEMVYSQTHFTHILCPMIQSFEGLRHYPQLLMYYIFRNSWWSLLTGISRGLAPSMNVSALNPYSQGLGRIPWSDGYPHQLVNSFLST